MVQLHPQHPRQTPLPTMYDLPSEDPEEPGLPDEFHDFQPALLTGTCQSPRHPRENCFIGTNLNLYYDSENTLWYKQPDWFLVLGAKQSRNQEQLRLSYVIWQEQISPFLVVELLSPGTEDEDLGRTQRQAHKPPTKWEVYQDILQVPYYVIYDRYENLFRAFKRQAGKYEPLDLTAGKLWLEELELGLAVWSGDYEDVTGLWLRFYDRQGNWVPTPSEQAQKERQRAEIAQQEKERAEASLEEERKKNQQLRARLQELGIDPDLI